MTAETVLKLAAEVGEEGTLNALIGGLIGFILSSPRCLARAAMR